VVASRYCTNKRIVPESLHYSVGTRFTKHEGKYTMLQEGSNDCILITSEKLNNNNTEWHDVPVNHLLMVDEDIRVQMRQL
jgi:glutamine amidotransferase